MRVVARQRVNELVSDSLLLERARRQISALRRRLVEAEAAATIASPPAPCPRPLTLKKVEPPPASAKTPPLAAETKAVALTSPETQGGSSSGGDNSNGSCTVRCDEITRSGGGRRCEKYSSLVAIPREARSREHLAGERLIGNNSMGASEASDVRTTEASSRRRCATTQAPEDVLKSEAKSPTQRPHHAGQGFLDGDVNNGRPRPLPSPSLSEMREGKREGVVKIKALLNARRGRDIVVRGRIATAIAAANAAAAAAAAVASAISAAGGGRSRHASANRHAARTINSTSAQNGVPTGPARSQFFMPRDDSRTTKATRKPAFRPPFSSTSVRPPPPARGAKGFAAVASTIGVTAAGKRRADERSVATQALIERFSTREEELLRELETWKARCKSLEKTEEAPPRIIVGGCAGASHCGGGIGEKTVREKPIGLETAPTATRAMPPVPGPAKPQSPLQAISRASPAAIRMSEQETPGSSQASADPHRLTRSGVGTGSAPNSLVPEQGCHVDPRRRACIEVHAYSMRSRNLSRTPTSTAVGGIEGEFLKRYCGLCIQQCRRWRQ